MRDGAASSQLVAPRKVHVVVHSTLPARAVWEKLAVWAAPYFGLAVATSGAAIGSTREMADESGTYVERLVARCDRSMRFSYTILESPLPISSHVAHVRVLDHAGAGAGCTVTWDVRRAPT